MGLHCALIGSVKETGYSLEYVTDYARDLLVVERPETLKDFYAIQTCDNLYEAIGLQRGIFLEGGHVDVEKVRQTFLKDIQNGRLGRITWDHL